MIDDRQSAFGDPARELATIQFDGTGPLAAALGLIQRVQTLGYPVVIDSLQITPDGSKPGTLKLKVCPKTVELYELRSVSGRPSRGRSTPVYGMQLAPSEVVGR